MLSYKLVSLYMLLIYMWLMYLLSGWETEMETSTDRVSAESDSRRYLRWVQISVFLAYGISGVCVVSVID